MLKNKKLSFLGLLHKGGNLLYGPELKSSYQKASLILENKGEESGERLRFRKKIKEANIAYLAEEFSEEELGDALGKSPISFVGILGKKAKDAYLRKEEES